jgi:hypothetical protein
MTLTADVVRKPKECMVCGSLVCESCLKTWSDKNNQNNIICECPMRCKKTSDIKESIMKPIGKVIKNILYNMELKCPNQTCGEVMILEKYVDHEYYCHLPKCQNILCGQGNEKLINVRCRLNLFSILMRMRKSLGFVRRCVSIR